MAVGVTRRAPGGGLAAALLMFPTGLVLGGLVMAPMAAVAVYSVLSQAPPGAALSLVQWQTVLGSQGIYLGLLGRSLGMAAAVTVATAAISYPAAYALAKVVRRGRLTWLSLCMVPFLTSSILLIYAFLVLFGPSGPLMDLLAALHLASASASLIYTPWAVALMLVYEYIPYMVLSLYSSLERIDPSVVEAARSLGAGRLRLFGQVLFPLSLPGLAVGVVLVFPPAAGAFVEPQILGGPSAVLLGNAIQNQITLVYNWPLGACLSFLLLVAVLACLGAVQGAVALATWWRRRAAPAPAVGGRGVEA